MASPLELATGSKSVTTSAVQIVHSSQLGGQRPVHGIQIIPDSGNSGTVYVGGSTVTADGGDSTTGIPVPSTGLFLPLRRQEDLYGISDSGTNKLFYYIT